ncbi:alcohol dehydrogenase catalytic domain-containing protein [Primorskyibacter aestuariivivens]|uniref:zinc-dependent alcohol dehydrogenase n=1 Tax=Primorskyibacter aestuariivivens TaxID=1888912 RepID=UPI0023007962|nr:alcohol dehydrogenase catalytic domain-containing protein [Primorskyibacter aestuariivivens]MDA7429392.1 alcohol dehydrogenase catalytic domain-containing protein [Primorskyibacter aestuariivivens]
MKALVYTGPEALEFRDVADPVAEPGQVLIRIDSSGICGSDMHAFLGHDARRPAPLILGHEAAGVITGGSRDGDRVTINPLVNCGTCPACLTGRENLCPERKIISMPPREGAFAQYVTMREENLVTVPDDFPLEKAALAEPMAVSWHSAKLGLAALHPGDERRALVIGGGAIGLAAALALRAMGCEDVTIVEPNPTRRTYLEQQCGIAAVSQGAGLWPMVVDAVGYAATRAVASELTAPGAVIVHIGLGEDSGGLDVRRMTLQEITFIGTYTYTAQDFRDTAQAMFDGRLGALDWIEQRSLSDGAAAFEDIRAGRVAAPKIVLKPN